MNKPDALENLLTTIISDFFETFPVNNPVAPEYRIVDCISDAYVALRPDIIKRSSVSIEQLNQYNGFTVPPKSMDGVFIILINKNVLAENMQNRRMDWVGTIVHETTHVQDYARYAEIVGANTYDEILQVSEHGMFNLWTEVNARSKGYYFTRKYTVGEANLHNTRLVPDIKNREIPWQHQYMHQQYHATTDGYQQAYFVAQYIGRLYTLQQLFPRSFDDKWIINHFGINRWMADWFFFYKEYPVLTDAAEHFEDMKNILRKNFRGL